MTPAHQLAAQIAEAQTKIVFGLPGGGPSLDLIDALARHGVPFVRTAHETSAALMAGTCGRLTSRCGVAVSIKGPGLANLVPGLAACRLEAFPLVAIAEAYHSSTPFARAHKRMDHSRLVQEVVKGHLAFSTEGPAFNEWAAWAEAEIPGPVQIDLATETEGPSPPPPQPGRVRHQESLALDLLAKAQRPLVVAGTLAMRRDWSDLLSGLEIPVFSSAAAKGVVDETLEHAAGVYTGVGGELAPESSLLPDADLVVGIGLRSNEVLRASPFPVPAINIDPLGCTHSSGFDLAATLPPERIREALDLLGENSWGLDRLRAAVATMEADLLAAPFLPARVFRSLWQRFGGEACLVVDTGNFCTIAEHVWAARSHRGFLGAGQSRYMGTAVPMALAAALLVDDRPTVTAVGDGGVGMAFGELKIAVEHQLPLMVVFMSDGSFASIRQRARAQGLDERSLVMDRPSWQAAAGGLGMATAVAENHQDLERALAAWSPAGGPLFLECRFDPESYLHMTTKLR